MTYFKFSTLALLFLTLTACDTDIPEVDNDPPTFSFKVTGDGFDRTFTQDDDFSNLQLNLREDVDYDMIFSSADLGGVQSTLLRYDANYIEYDNDPPFPAAPWTQELSGLSFFVDWVGDQSAPLTGNILVGTFRPNGGNISTTFFFSVRDFGGEANMPNTTSGQLNIFIGDFNTELISF
ncbi:hypothetical protein [Psychroserpens sp.]|uniref:hypothetical protein n=1 Tax=Psychroserpens sp. TaxID=2020870 RepID=UPI003C719543